MIVGSIKKERTALLLFWVIYALLSFYFYKERNTYADNSFYLFNIIQQQSFSFQHLRFIAAAWQWLPVLAVKMQLSLQMVMLSAVAGVYLWHLLLFICIRLLSPEKWISYLFLLFLVATIHDAFYYMQTELLNGCGLMLVLVAVLRNTSFSYSEKFIGVAFISLLFVWTHLFILLVAGMVLGIYFLAQPNTYRFGYLLIAAVGLALKIWIVKDAYDNNTMQVFDYRVITLRNLHASFFAKSFLQSAKMYGLAIAFMVIMWWAHPKKWWLTLALSLGIVSLYVLLVVYLRHGSFSAYMDLYKVTFFTFCWAVVALLISSEVMNKYRLAPLLLVLILTVSFIRLFSEKKYIERAVWLENKLQQPAAKMILPLDVAPSSFQMDSWTVPYETLLLSSLKGASKTILMEEPRYPVAAYLQDSTRFLGAGWLLEDTTPLNGRYFHLPPQPYVYISR